MTPINTNLKQYIFNNKTDNQSELLELGNGDLSKVVAFVHGHQMNTRMGAWEMVRFAEPLLNAGFTVLIPSIKGHGKTSGDRDMYGPETLKRLHDSLQEWQKENNHSEKLSILGSSRGGSIATLMSGHYSNMFNCGVSAPGVYDLKTQFENTTNPHKLKNIEIECGTTDENFAVRSASSILETLTTPLLLIHGEEDEEINVQQAKDFDKLLTKNGKEHEATILPGKGHGLLSKEIFDEYIIPFLKKHS